MRSRGYSLRTEKSYLTWIYSYIKFHKTNHPKDMGVEDVIKYLDFLSFQKRKASYIYGKKIFVYFLDRHSRVNTHQEPHHLDLIFSKTVINSGLY